MNRNVIFGVILTFLVFFSWQLSFYIKVPFGNGIGQKGIKIRGTNMNRVEKNAMSKMDLDMMELKGDDYCLKFIKNNINVQVTDSNLRSLLTVCKTSENNKDNAMIKEFVSDLQCNPNANLSNIKKPLVALASYPGSGNTMTRRIVEILTGTLTAYDHMVVGCTSRGYRYIIKTHMMHFGPGDTKCQGLNYTEAIYIIRNPFKAIYAEYNRYHASVNLQVPLLSKDTYFGKNWIKYVMLQAERWKRMSAFWLREFRRPVHVFFYESITENRMAEVFRLSKVLHVNLTMKMLLCTFSQYVEEKKRTYPVSLSSKSLYDLYGNYIIKLVNEAILKVYQIVHLNELREYILPLPDKN